MRLHTAKTAQNRNLCHDVLTDQRVILFREHEGLGDYGRRGVRQDPRASLDRAELAGHAAPGSSADKIHLQALAVLRGPLLGDPVKLDDIDALIRERAGHESD